MSRLRQEMRKRGLPSNSKRIEFVEKLCLIWPTSNILFSIFFYINSLGENNDKFTPCGFCKRTLTVKMLLRHAEECGKKNKGPKLKINPKYGPLPELLNNFDDLIQR